MPAGAGRWGPLMPRVNVYLPDDLADELASTMPGLNLSGALQEAIRLRLQCTHDLLECPRCARQLERHDLTDDLVSRFYSDCLWELEPLVNKRGTAEGACQLLRRVAQRWALSNSGRPLPRPARAARRAPVHELPSSLAG